MKTNTLKCSKVIKISPTPTITPMNSVEDSLEVPKNNRGNPA
jgi:hypothetical protein